MTVHCCDSLYVIEWSGYTEADQEAKRGMKKPTQPTIAHDETHEVGELSQWRQKLPKQNILSSNWKDI